MKVEAPLKTIFEPEFCIFVTRNEIPVENRLRNHQFIIYMENYGKLSVWPRN